MLSSYRQHSLLCCSPHTLAKSSNESLVAVVAVIVVVVENNLCQRRQLDIMVDSNKRQISERLFAEPQMAFHFQY